MYATLRRALFAVVFVAAVLLGLFHPVSPADSDQLPSPAAYFGSGWLAVVTAVIVRTLVWLAAGGKLLCLQIGLGRPRWWWITPTGTTVALSWLPLAVQGTGVAARRSRDRAAQLALLGTSAAFLAGGVLGVFTAPARMIPACLGVAAIGLSTLLPRKPPVFWRALTPGFDPAPGRIADAAVRARALNDADAALAVMSELPYREPPEMPMRLYDVRSWALSRVGRHGEAVRSVRENVDPAVGPTGWQRVALGDALCAAWEAHDESGLTARREIPELAERGLEEVPKLNRADLFAVAALYDGAAAEAYDRASVPARRMPRGHRAWSLCTMASAAIELGRFEEARRLLARARADDPGEPRIGYITAQVDLADPQGEPVSA